MLFLPASLRVTARLKPCPSYAVLSRAPSVWLTPHFHGQLDSGVGGDGLDFGLGLRGGGSFADVAAEDRGEIDCLVVFG
jgi:hypothetical protein